MGKKIRIIQLSEFSRSEPTHVNKFLGLKKKKRSTISTLYGEVLSSQQRQDREPTVAQSMSSLLPHSDLN